MFRFEEDPSLDFQCGVNIFCNANEAAAKMLSGVLGWLAEGILGHNNLEAGGALWTAALSQTETWLGLAVFVMMITGVIGITLALLTARPDMMKRALIGTLLAFPSTMFAFWLIYEVLQVVDDFSQGLLTQITDGPEGFEGLFGTLFKSQNGWEDLAIATGAAGRHALVILILIILVIGMLFMFFALAFRDFILLILIAFAPLAFMALPLEAGATWLRRWGSAVIAMLLAKPLLLGTLSLVLSGFSHLDSIWSVETITLGIGMLIISFLPLMMFSFFSFIGGSDSGDQAGSKLAGTAMAGTKIAAAGLTGGVAGAAAGAGTSGGAEAGAAEQGQGGSGSGQQSAGAGAPITVGSGSAQSQQAVPEQPASSAQSAPPQSSQPPQSEQTPPSSSHQHQQAPVQQQHVQPPPQAEPSREMFEPVEERTVVSQRPAASNDV